MIRYFIRYNGEKIKATKELIDRLNYYLIECTTLIEGLTKNERVFVLGRLSDEEEQDANKIIERYLVGENNE